MFRGAGVRCSSLNIKLPSSVVTIGLANSVVLTPESISRPSRKSNMICFGRASRGTGLGAANDGDGRLSAAGERERLDPTTC
jgi:hypothetical protein